jgi:hypothetical protein
MTYDREAKRARREKLGYVKLTLDKDGDYDDEVVLSVCHNGYQASNINLSCYEAEKVVFLLKKHFGI